MLLCSNLYRNIGKITWLENGITSNTKLTKSKQSQRASSLWVGELHHIT